MKTKIKFICASNYPNDISFGIFSWIYSYDGYIWGKGRTWAIGLIFFHTGISFFKAYDTEKK